MTQENPFKDINDDISKQRQARVKRDKEVLARLKTLLEPFNEAVTRNLLLLAEARDWKDPTIVDYNPQLFGWRFVAFSGPGRYGRFIDINLQPSWSTYFSPEYFTRLRGFPLFNDGLPKSRYLVEMHTPSSSFLGHGSSYKELSENSSEKEFVFTLKNVVTTFEFRFLKGQ